MGGMVSERWIDANGTYGTSILAISSEFQPSQRYISSRNSSYDYTSTAPYVEVPMLHVGDGV